MFVGKTIFLITTEMRLTF